MNTEVKPSESSHSWIGQGEDLLPERFPWLMNLSAAFMGSFVPKPETTSELHENLLWEDFLAILEPREKHITVCLKNGMTKVGEISKELGYANHSPISKALARIRQKARRYLESSVTVGMALAPGVGTRPFGLPAGGGCHRMT